MPDLEEPVQKKRNGSKVIVCSPPDAQVEAYAQKVCQRLSKGKTELDIVDGFTQFMKLVVKIRAKQLGGHHEEAQ